MLVGSPLSPWTATILEERISAREHVSPVGRTLTRRRKNQAAQPRVSDTKSPKPYSQSADSEALDPQTPAIMRDAVFDLFRVG